MPRKAAAATTETPATETQEKSGVENLALWESVQATDPRYTKKFTRGGGFSGTAINATYLAKKATETFGPIGTGWGVLVEDEQYAEGAPIVDDKHGLVGTEIIHVLRIMLWYELNGIRGEVRHYGQTVFVGKNKHGVFTDEEAPKKSLTDAMSKALSLLGFASDVHLGLYDDNKYVNDLKVAIAEAEKPKGPTLQELLDRLNAATTLEDLKTSVVSASLLSDPDKATLKVAYLAKQTALKGTP
jgi:hypothetical protein